MKSVIRSGHFTGRKKMAFFCFLSPFNVKHHILLGLPHLFGFALTVKWNRFSLFWGDLIRFLFSESLSSSICFKPKGAQVYVCSEGLTTASEAATVIRYSPAALQRVFPVSLRVAHCCSLERGAQLCLPSRQRS